MAAGLLVVALVVGGLVALDPLDWRGPASRGEAIEDAVRDVPSAPVTVQHVGDGASTGEAAVADFLDAVIAGIPGVNQPSAVVGSEQLRLDTRVTPTAWEDQQPLGFLAGQPDGFPNGRRIADDVVDISLQAVAGATAVGDCNGQHPNNKLGDGTVGNDKPQLNSFPYLPHPHQGYEHDHDHTTEDDPVTNSRTHQLRRLYRAFFLREADDAGLNYWVDNDNNLISIANQFAASAEFINRYGTLTDEQFVDRVYLNVLGRPSDADGKAYRLNLLDTGQLTRGGMMRYFANSDEFIKTVG